MRGTTKGRARARSGEQRKDGRGRAAGNSERTGSGAGSQAQAGNNGKGGKGRARARSGEQRKDGLGRGLASASASGELRERRERTGAQCGEQPERSERLIAACDWPIQLCLPPQPRSTIGLWLSIAQTDRTSRQYSIMSDWTFTRSPSRHWLAPPSSLAGFRHVTASCGRSCCEHARRSASTLRRDPASSVLPKRRASTALHDGQPRSPLRFWTLSECSAWQSLSTSSK
jgi:hypothetical protein